MGDTSPLAIRDIDNADAMAVMPILRAMGAHHIDGPAVVNGAIEVNHFVIADAAPFVLGAMDVVNLLDGHLTAFRRSRAMNDYLTYFAVHCSPPSSLASISDLSSANLVWI